MCEAPPGSLINSQCESKVKIAEEQKVGVRSLARNMLKGRGAC